MNISLVIIVSKWNQSHSRKSFIALECWNGCVLIYQKMGQTYRHKTTQMFMPSLLMSVVIFEQLLREKRRENKVFGLSIASQKFVKPCHTAGHTNEIAVELILVKNQFKFCTCARVKCGIFQMCRYTHRC